MAPINFYDKQSAFLATHTEPTLNTGTPTAPDNATNGWTIRVAWADQATAPVVTPAFGNIIDLDYGSTVLASFTLEHPGQLCRFRFSEGNWYLNRYGGVPMQHTPGGFIDYNDTGTAASPIALVADTWTTVTNNGMGSSTNQNFLPAGVSELMDTSSGAFDFTDLSLGDTVFIRNDISVTPNVNNASLELRYQLGTGSGLYYLEKRLGRLDEGSGRPYRISLEPDQIYMGDSNTRDNPGVLQVKLSSAGSLVNAGCAIQVVKWIVG